VIGESSLLPLFQQQRVLMYSVRDYCRRDMLASAQSLLEIADGFAAQMLPMELAQLNVERSRSKAGSFGALAILQKEGRFSRD